MEVDLQIITINIPDSNYAVELQVFDIGGNGLLFNTDNNIDLRRKYFQLVDHVIAAYNVSNRITFDSLRSNWLKLFKATHNTKSNEQYSGVILGLQSDLSKYSTVNPKEAIALAKEYNLVAMQCSAKLNQDIDNPFNYLAQQVYLKYINQRQSE